MGAVAMGGKWSGRFPPGLRVLSAIQALVIVWFVLVVLANADVSFAKVTGVPLLSIWFVVGIGALGCVMNLFTPARLERIVWGPIIVVMLACTLIVAMNR